MSKGWGSLRDLHAWLEALAPQVLPESRLGKAVYYTLGQWQKLSAFLTHGEVPLTNNRCENAIRPFVGKRAINRVAAVPRIRPRGCSASR